MLKLCGNPTRCQSASSRVVFCPSGTSRRSKRQPALKLSRVRTVPLTGSARPGAATAHPAHPIDAIETIPMNMRISNRLIILPLYAASLADLAAAAATVTRQQARRRLRQHLLILGEAHE